MQYHATKPRISVIIPAYNAENTILETIASVQSQTFSDFEIIVINDGSTDSTLEKVTDLTDARIYITSYDNGGLPTARNRGIALARGEYITFLDADDLWTPDKLECQLAAFSKSPDAGLVYSWTSFMDEQGQTVHPDTPIFFEGNVLKDLLCHNFLRNGSNPLLKRSVVAAVGDFDPKLGSAEDWDYWLRVASGWSFAVVPKAQILYRQSSNTMSSNVERMEKYQLEVLERAFASAPQNLQFLKPRSLAYIYQYSAKLYLSRKMSVEGTNDAITKLGQAIKRYPQSLLSKETQKLIIKLMIMKFLPITFGKSLLGKISRKRAKSIVLH